MGMNAENMGCVTHTIAMLILAFMKFEVSELDFPDFLARRPAKFCSATATWLHFQTLHHMKPQRERSDGVGPDSLGGISSSFHAHWIEGMLPVADECWMVHQDSW